MKKMANSMASSTVFQPDANLSMQGKKKKLMSGQASQEKVNEYGGFLP
jgi:hypothetical protein